jgi:hypothetical protein
MRSDGFAGNHDQARYNRAIENRRMTFTASHSDRATIFGNENYNVRSAGDIKFAELAAQLRIAARESALDKWPVQSRQAPSSLSVHSVFVTPAN